MCCAVLRFPALRNRSWTLLVNLLAAFHVCQRLHLKQEAVGILRRRMQWCLTQVRHQFSLLDLERQGSTACGHLPTYGRDSAHVRSGIFVNLHGFPPQLLPAGWLVASIDVVKTQTLASRTIMGLSALYFECKLRVRTQRLYWQGAGVGLSPATPISPYLWPNEEPLLLQ